MTLLKDIHELKEYVKVLEEMGATTKEDLYYLDYAIAKTYMKLGDYERLMNVVNKVKEKNKEERDSQEKSKMIDMGSFYQLRKSSESTSKKTDIDKKELENFARICGITFNDIAKLKDFHHRLFSSEHDKSKLEEEILKKININRFMLRKILHYSGNYDKLYPYSFAICVGIDNYLNLDHLEGAAEGAKEMAKTLKQLNFEVDLLTNEQATTVEVGSKLGGLRQRLERLNNSNSLVVFYFAGHGYSKDESFQLCPYNFDENNIIETGQNLLNLKNRILSTFPCKHFLFIFDCYFSPTLFETQHVELEKPSDRGSVIYCNKTKKSIWAVTSNTKDTKKRGELVTHFVDVLSSKTSSNEQGSNIVDLKEIMQKVHEKMSSATYATFSGSPIEFGVPMFTYKGKSPYVYFTDAQMKEGERVSEEQFKKSERYKKIHLIKDTTFKQIKQNVAAFYQDNSQKPKFGWKILDSKKSPVSPDNIFQLFQDAKLNNKSALVVVRGERGTGKTLLSQVLSSLKPNEFFNDFVFSVNLKGDSIQKVDEFYNHFFNTFLKQCDFYEEDRSKVIEVLKDKESQGRILWIFDVDFLSAKSKDFLVNNFKKMLVLTSSEIPLNSYAEFTLVGYEEKINDFLKKEFPKHSLLFNQPSLSKMLTIPSYLETFKKHSEESHFQIIQAIVNQNLERFGKWKEQVILLLQSLSFYQFRNQLTSISMTRIEKKLREIDQKLSDSSEEIISLLEFNGVLKKISNYEFDFQYSLMRDYFVALLFSSCIEKTITPSLKDFEKTANYTSNLQNLFSSESLVPPFICSMLKSKEQITKIFDSALNAKKLTKKISDILALSLHFSPIQISVEYLRNLKSKDIQPEKQQKLLDSCCKSGVDTRICEQFLGMNLDFETPFLLAVENENMQVAKKVAEKVQVNDELAVRCTQQNFEVAYFLQGSIEPTFPFFSNLCRNGSLKDLVNFYNARKHRHMINEIFQEAARFGRLEMLQYLIQKKGVNLNDALLAVCLESFHSNIQVFKFLIDKGANNLDDAFVTLFQSDIIDTKIVEFFLSKGAKVNHKKENRSALDYACYGLNRTLEPVVMLVENGACDLQTSFSYAFNDNMLNSEISNYLKEKGCYEHDITSYPQTTKTKDLDSFLCNFFPEYSQELEIESIFSYNTSDELFLQCTLPTPDLEKIKQLLTSLSHREIQRALLEICKKSSVDTSIYDLILEDPVHLSARNGRGLGLLYHTCCSGNTKALDYFLDKGLDDFEELVEGVNDNPSHVQVFDLVKVIEKRDFKQPKSSRLKHSVLQNFEMCRHEVLRNYLSTKVGAIINKIFKNLVYDGNQEVLSLSLIDKVNYDLEDSQGKTPLHYYCQNKNIRSDLLEYIIMRTTRNNPDKNNRTALHLACMNKNVTLGMIKIICQKFGDVLTKDVDDNYPVFYAIQNINVEIYEYFKKDSKSQESYKKASKNEETHLSWLCQTKDFKRDDKHFFDSVQQYKSSVYYAFKNANADSVALLINDKLEYVEEALEGALASGNLQLVKELIEKKQVKNYSGQDRLKKVLFANVLNSYEFEANYLRKVLNEVSQRNYSNRTDLLRSPPLLLNLCKGDPFSKSLNQIFKKARVQRNYSHNQHKRVVKFLKDNAFQAKIASDDIKTTWIKDYLSIPLLVINCKLRVYEKNLEINHEGSWHRIDIFFANLQHFLARFLYFNVLEFSDDSISNKDFYSNQQFNTIISKLNKFEDRVNGSTFFGNVLKFFVFEEKTFKESFRNSSSYFTNVSFVEQLREMPMKVVKPAREHDKSFLIVNLSDDKIDLQKFEKINFNLSYKIVTSLSELEKENEEMDQRKKNKWIVIIFFNGDGDKVKIAERKSRFVRSRSGETGNGEVPTPLVFATPKSANNNNNQPNNNNKNQIQQHKTFDYKTVSLDSIKEHIRPYNPAAVFAFAINNEEISNETEIFRKERMLDFTDIFFYNYTYREAEKHLAFVGWILTKVKNHNMSFEGAYMEYILRNKSFKTMTPRFKYGYVQKPVEDLQCIDNLCLEGFDQKSRLTNYNPYVSAVIDGNVRAIKLLLQSQCQGINGNDHSGRTPLIISVLKDCFEITVLLLTSKEVDINAIDPMSGNTALHICCAKYQDTLVNILLDKKANLNILNYGFSSPLHFAFKYGTITTEMQEKIRAQQICTNLIQKGADPKKDYFGEVSQFLYGSVWKKKEPLFIDWYERVVSNQQNNNLGVLAQLRDKDFFSTETIKQPKVESIFDDDSNHIDNSQTRSAFITKRPNLSNRFLFINCNPRKTHEGLETVGILSLISNKIKKFFEQIDFLGNIDECSTIDDLKELNQVNSYKMVYFHGYYQNESFVFLDPNGEPVENLTPKDFFNILNTKSLFLNLENFTQKQALQLHQSNNKFKILITNQRKPNEFEHFHFIEILLKGILVHGDTIKGGADRAFKYVVQQDNISTNHIPPYFYTFKEDNVKIEKIMK